MTELKGHRFGNAKPLFFMGRNWESGAAAARGTGYRAGTIQMWVAKGLTEPPEDHVPSPLRGRRVGSRGPKHSWKGIGL